MRSAPKSVSPPRPVSLVRLFTALADRTRLRLLNLLAGRELCVCYLVEVLGQSQPKISRHLAYLRQAGIVSARRQGKWMHYRLVWPANAGAARIFDATLASFRDDREMRADLARLASACYAPERFVTLHGAPSPAHINVDTA
jgi:ArsR family transcriptional regulator